jgi:hypothetical protein
MLDSLCDTRDPANPKSFKECAHRIVNLDETGCPKDVKNGMACVAPKNLAFALQRAGAVDARSQVKRAGGANRF